MAIQNLYPALKPSLLLDFSNTKALDPRVSFSRASEGRFYGTQVAKAEENLLLRSEEFENAAWSRASITSVTANTSAAPDGATTAETVVFTGGGTASGIFQTAPVATGVTYTQSVFFKYVDQQWMQLTFNAGTFGSGQYANFDVQNGVLGTVAGGTATITGAGGGWYRCTFTATASGTGSNVAVCNPVAVDNGTATRLQALTASNTSVLMWGAQTEIRSAATAYTPTTDQPITNYIPVLQAAGNNVARFDHNPVTGESLGLLIEEQRTNLILRSEDFSTTWAATRASVTTNTIVAPDGTLTGDSFVIDATASNNHSISQNQSITSGTTYTWSVYAKAGQISQINLRFSAQFPAGNAFFDLISGTVTSVGTVVASSITPVGNGWYRCTFTQTANATGTGAAQVFLAVSGSVTITTANGYDSVFLWGAQLEAGAFPTSYIPTVASQVTRSADAASMTGANFSSWYSADNVGTVYVEANETFVGTNSAPWWLNAGTNLRGIAYRRAASTNNLQLSYRQPDGTTRDTTVDSAIPAGQYNKVAAAFNASSSSVSVNGVAATTSTSNNLYPSVDQLRIGFAQVSGSAPYVWCGTIKKLSYYPKRLTDAELQGLTS
jgi:hypothetical protein